MTDDATTTPERRDLNRPKTLRLKSISPGITVSDLDASLAWYCDTVGFHLEDKFEHEGKVVGAALVAGTEHLMLSQDDWAKGRDRVRGQAIRLYFQSSEDIDEVAQRIKSRGGKLASEPADMPWGARSFNLLDPDGFQLTITT